MKRRVGQCRAAVRLSIARSACSGTTCRWSETRRRPTSSWCCRATGTTAVDVLDPSELPTANGRGGLFPFALVDRRARSEAVGDERANNGRHDRHCPGDFRSDQDGDDRDP